MVEKAVENVGEGRVEKVESEMGEIGSSEKAGRRSAMMGENGRGESFGDSGKGSCGMKLSAAWRLCDVQDTDCLGVAIEAELCLR